MTTPNDSQSELIENTEGCYLVDAGPGTGKTFTITRRYAEIVDQDGVEPDDVLLLTFTRNAATEMRDRIVAHSDYGVRELRDAPIGTFHSLCNDVLREHGFDAPTNLGIDEAITGSTQILEDESIESEYFREFIGCFADEHPDHHDVLRAISNPTDVLDVLKNLAAKGVFPTADGWYRDCDEHLSGDFDAFSETFDELNEPRNDGNKQSRLRSTLGRYGRDACYLPDAPEKHVVRGEYGSKTVPKAVARQVFDEDREDLVSFVHDVYMAYIEFSLSRNYLNFAFLQLFAFVHLCENEPLRDRLAFEYVMIDEFQDTSEIQFKLALLLSGTDNVCAVGDWKQSIYSFQYAAVENITDFRGRLRRFIDDLNADRTRIEAPFDPIHEIELGRNYRSTKSIIDRSEDALVVPVTSREEVDADAILDDVVSLDADTAHDHSTIEAINHEDEHEAILTKIDEIVGNEAYAIRDGGELRPPTYGDVAVLTRTRNFGRELLSVAEEYGFPVAYEGGIELFRTDPAKLLLAWLRILEADANEDRGWAVVLERAGYTLDEMKYVLSTGAYPSAMVAFRSELTSLETVSAVAHRVFDRYGYDGPTAAVLRTKIQSIHDGTTITRGGVIRFIERGIETGTTYEVTAASRADSVVVQTIHSAKGLEYPIVLLANVNRGAFPPAGGSGGSIVYDEAFGIRQRTRYGEEHGQPHVYDNWYWDVLKCCRQREYDEERRLLYVAMTRARDHLVFTAGEKPGSFLTDLPIDVVEMEPNVEHDPQSNTVQTTFDVGIPEPDGPVGYSPHSLMNEDVFEGVEDGRGPEFGSRVHDFAEQYALEEEVEPRDADGDEDQANVKRLLDSMDGELRVEKNVHLPLSVDGIRVAIHGIVDLVHVTEETVEIIDYKTDLSRRAEAEYRTQLSVYSHVLRSVYPERAVTAFLFYTADNELVPMEPRPMDELRMLVRDRLDRTARSDPSL